MTRGRPTFAMRFIRLVGWWVVAWVALPLAIAQSPTAAPDLGAAGWVSIDSVSGPPLNLRAWWFPAQAAASGPRPVVLMLHGCGGMLNRQGLPSARFRIQATAFQAQGWHSLALDSLTPRGESELCTQRIGQRAVTQTERVRDVAAALAWLTQQLGAVDSRRIALVGWSHGGSTVLAATNRKHPITASPDVQTVMPPLAGAVAFYPGCSAELQRGHRPSVPVVLMVGLADDWTPPEPCLALAATHPLFTVHRWADAHHGFDSDAPVRWRADVPNGARPGQGVHVGGNPVARNESRALLLQALQRAFAAP